MNKSFNLKTTALAVRNWISPTTAGCGFILVAVALASFALSQTTLAVSPAPDGGYANNNTAEGTDALFKLTSGTYNTANGASALYSNTTGNYNTAIGAGALYSNTTGSGNTATGGAALASNTTGQGNTANGAGALALTTIGSQNTANGAGALTKNTTGGFNTANGDAALYSNTIGAQNTADGVKALTSNTSGARNTANGYQALISNTTGSSNIALGYQAGYKLTTGSNNIDIGNIGVAGSANTIRIGNAVATLYPDGTMHPAQTAAYIAGIHGVAVTGAAVAVSSSGQLGVAPSSKRFKDEIKPMDKASEAILALKPVTFRYKKELDPEGISQFGLVAEEVEKVNPDLVARDEKGQVYTVRYEAVNAMLLNEFLKEHRKVQEQEATIAQLKSSGSNQEATIVQLKKGMEILTASLKEQAAQIQKVSAQLESNKPAPQIAVNNQ